MKHTFLLIALAATLVACVRKDPDAGKFAAPEIVDVYAATGADPTRVIIVARVSSMDGIKECGILFGRDEIERIPSSNMKDNAFSVLVDGLEWSTVYRFRAYLDGGRGQVLSDEKTWRTQDEIPPVAEIIKMSPALGANAGRITIHCMISDLAATSGTADLRCGICYSPLKEVPTIDDASAQAEGFSDNGAYSVELDGLVPSTLYHFRTWTRIGEQISYGQTKSQKIPSTAEVVVTGDYEDLKSYSVTLNGTCCLEEGTWNSRLCGFELDGTILFVDTVGDDGAFSLSVSALWPETTYRYRAFVNVDGTTFYGQERSFQTPPTAAQENEYVDLGLSVYWAACNLGATKPDEVGDAYSWGETEPWQQGRPYKWILGDRYLKYTLSIDTPQADGKTILEPEDDAAHVHLGGKWRMPTGREFDELLKNCEIVKKEFGELSGYLLTSKIEGFTDRSIFLPHEHYWSSQLSSGSSACARATMLTFDDNMNYTLRIVNFFPEMGDFAFDYYSPYLYRTSGRLVRPVRDR